MLTITVPGRPRTQGSAKMVVDPKTRRPVMKKTPAEVAHRALVAWTVRTEAAKAGVRFPKPAAVRLTILAGFARPQRHFDARGNLRPAAVTAKHTQTPDLDKLYRLIGDALTEAGVLDDDSQITTAHCVKTWADSDFTTITIEEDQ